MRLRFLGFTRAGPTSRTRKTAASASPLILCSVNQTSSAESGLSRIESLSQVSGVVGCQWGDEGKSKLIDVLSSAFRCRRSLSGHIINNKKGKKFALHLVPSGILNKETVCVIGNGVMVNLPSFFKEIDLLESVGVSCKGRILVSDQAHLLFDLQQQADALHEIELSKSVFGTTKTGIEPCNSSKVTRNGIRVGDLRDMDTFPQKLDALLSEVASRFPSFINYTPNSNMLWEEVERCKRFAESLEPFIADTVDFLNKSISRNKKVLVEGGQATMLDINFGTCPFVTSSSPSAGRICTGLGIAPKVLGDLIGVVKAYTTRVGPGPLPTEILAQRVDMIRFVGQEYDRITPCRRHRIGWLDIVSLKHCCQINGITSLYLTKLDVLSHVSEIPIGFSYKHRDGTPIKSFPADLKVLKHVKVEYETLPGWKRDITNVRKYSELPAAAKRYIERMEELVGVPIHYIGVGPLRVAMIYK